MKKIGFASTRIAGTDGVTLETYKWYQVLQRNGYECYFFAGELDIPPERSFLEPKAHFEHPEILEPQASCFGTLKREQQLTKHIQELKEYLKSKLREFCDAFGIEMLIPENVLAIPRIFPLEWQLRNSWQKPVCPPSFTTMILAGKGNAFLSMPSKTTSSMPFPLTYIVSTMW